MNGMSRKMQPATSFISIKIFFGKLGFGALCALQLFLGVNYFFPANEEGYLRKRDRNQRDDEKSKAGFDISRKQANTDDDKIEGVENEYRGAVTQSQVHQLVVNVIAVGRER